MKVNRQQNKKSGQALVEFTVAMISILVLTAGLLQMSTLAAKRAEVMVNARRDAALRASADMGNDVDVISDAEYIRDWYPGSDNAQYTYDDVLTHGDQIAFEMTLVDKSAPDTTGWETITKTQSRIGRLRATPQPVTCFGLVKGSDRKNVEIIPAVRDLLYKADSLTVRADVYMTWRKGIY